MQQGTFNLKYPKVLEGWDVGLFTQDVRSPATRESSRKGELLKVVKCSLNYLDERAVSDSERYVALTLLTGCDNLN